jgi:hypothetical protein
MSNTKFHKRATVIYACKQKTRGSRVTVSTADTVGTISVSGTTVTGTGTSFITQATEGAYLYDANAYEVGRILSINSDTSITLYESILATSILATATNTKRAGTSAGTGVNTGASAFDGSSYSFGLGNANAIRVKEGMKFTFETETGAATYTGDELDRYEQTWVKDEFVTVDFETFVPILGAVFSNVIADSDLPLPDLYEACGLGVVSTNTNVAYTNTVASNEFLEVEFRLASPDLTVTAPYSSTEKVYVGYDLVGTIDADIADIGERGTFKFMLKGNTAGVVMLPKRVPDYKLQSLEIAEPFNSSPVNSNIRLVALDLLLQQASLTFDAATASIGETLKLGGLTFTANDNITRGQALAAWSDIASGSAYADINPLITSVATFGAAVTTASNNLTFSSDMEATLPVGSMLFRNFDNAYIGTIATIASGGLTATLTSNAAVASNNGTVFKYITKTALVYGTGNLTVTLGGSSVTFVSAQTLTAGTALFDNAGTFVGVLATVAANGLSGILKYPAEVAVAGAAFNYTTNFLSAFNGAFTSGTLANYKTAVMDATHVLITAVKIKANLESLNLTGTATQTTVTPLASVDTYAYRTKPTVSNLCIGKLNAPNITGLDLQRFKLSCETGFHQGAVTTDITVSVKEDIEGIFFEPNSHVGVEAALWLEWGQPSKNSLVQWKFSIVTISKVSPSEIGNFRAYDVTLRNIGKFTMTLS